MGSRHVSVRMRVCIFFYKKTPGTISCFTIPLYFLLFFKAYACVAKKISNVRQEKRHAHQECKLLDANLHLCSDPPQENENATETRKKRRETN